ncbi:MAG: hypothetical protein IJC66_06315, partial [Kiritimatiellae bacterium]|nr:hypothetical protein [Kiritimatiellia bacterium]
KVGSDLAFTIGKPANIIVDKNVTFEIYDNASGMYLYYGPSLTVNGTITGGQNWGCLYLFNGTHLVNKGGRVEVGRIQAAFNTVNMKGTVDTNYLLVEGATFNAEGAVVDAGAIHDSNNGGTRWGASTFNFLKGTKVTANTITLKYADSVINTDLTSEIKASKIIGMGTIKIDARTVVDTEKQMIFADMSEFTGRIEVVGGDYEIVADGVVITKNTANAFFDGYYYETFKGAFTAAVESDKGKASITVLGNSAVDYEMEIPAGKSIILDLGGKTLAKADGAKIVVDNAIVKIANGTLSGFSASDVEIKGDSVATFPSGTVDLAGFADSFYKTTNEDGSVSVATKFRSFIQVESGVPCIGFLKNATSEYKVYGKVELTDADWTLVEMDVPEVVVSDNPALPLKWHAPVAGEYRFFKVEMIEAN